MRTLLNGMEKQQGNRVDLVCPVCGKKFKAWPSEVGRGRKYCSPKCYCKVQPNRKLEQEGLEEALRNLYVEQKLTTIEIGKRLRCDPKTVTYWMDKLGIPRRSQSEIMTMNNPAKRPEVKKKMSEKAKKRAKKPSFRKRMSEVAKKLWADPEFRERKVKQLRESNSGENNPNYGNRYSHTEETKQHLRETSKRLWKKPEYARKVVSSLQEKPNSYEEVVIGVLEENNLPFKYVGNGQVVIDGKVPDFVATDGSKRVIELFGRPWHDPDHSDKIEVKYDRTEVGRTHFFSERGYDCLILWDDELSDEEEITKRIRVFTG